MPIFRKDVSNPSSPSGGLSAGPLEERSSGEPRGQITHIAAGSKVTGEIAGTTELLIDGEVEGKIRLDSAVVVGPKGKVEGEISGRVVRVGGKVVGNVRGIERVEVLSSGMLEGDIASARVIIAEGAFFKGKVEMTGEGAKGKGAGAAPPRPPESPGKPTP